MEESQPVDEHIATSMTPDVNSTIQLNSTSNNPFAFKGFLTVSRLDDYEDLIFFIPH
jgi:hypothetical protein